MTDKEFKRLSKSDLLDIIFELQKNEKELQGKNEELEQKLASKELKIENAGSIAEAALAVNGFFEVAQAAADQYAAQAAQLLERAQKEAEAIIADAHIKAEQIMKEAKDGKRTAGTDPAYKETVPENKENPADKNRN